jgi:trigger factor
MSKSKITPLEHSRIEIEHELDEKVLLSYEEKTLATLSAGLEIDGFRKGHVPADIARKHVGDRLLLEEMAEQAISAVYPELLKENKIDAIGRPEVTIMKLARGNPLIFKIATDVMPEIKLPDYKKIAKEENKKETPDTSATEEDIAKVILDLRKLRARKEHVHDENCAHNQAKSSEAGSLDASQEAFREKEEVIDETTLPELTDEFVATLGAFKTIAELRGKIKENVILEKTTAAKEKKRIAIVEKIMEEATAPLPKILIDSELDKMMYRMEADITQMGVAFPDYLKHLNKTEADLRKEYEGDAKKRALLELVLTNIALKEKIAPDEKAVTEQVDKLLEEYKDADTLRTKFYVEHILTNEEVFKFLEKQN